MKKVESLQQSIDGQLEAIENLNRIYLNQRAYIFILVFSLLLTIVQKGKNTRLLGYHAKVINFRLLIAK